MDNYFTLPRVIKALRDKGIGIVGTAKYQRAWPPTELKQVSDKDCTFNDFNYTIDDYGTLCARWMDNGMVFCVSTIHRTGQMVKRTRRKPRKTIKNQEHVDKVWGSNGKTEVFIPKLIDDYNHWMGGVDLVDQHIAYYHPNVRCRRNWLPMFIQLLSIIRTNSYIVHKKHFGKESLSHKKFTLEMISFFMKMKTTETSIANSIPSNAASYGESRQTEVSDLTSPSAGKKRTVAMMVQEKQKGHLNKLPPKPKRRSLLKYIELDQAFPKRKVLPRSLHQRVKGDVNSRPTCAYCAWAVKTYAHATHSDYQRMVKRTSYKCLFCDVHLCKEHFDWFHETAGMPPPDPTIKSCT